MIKNRLVAAGAAAALATGTALMAVPAHAATPAPAPTPAPSAPAKPGINVSKLPIHIDFDCLKKNAQERHQIELKIAKILVKDGTAKSRLWPLIPPRRSSIPFSRTRACWPNRVPS